MTHVAGTEVKSALVTVVVALVLAQSAPTPPDLILHNVRIYTVDARRSVVEAIAIRGDTIARLGSDVDVLASRGPATRVIDLGGAAVLPGLHDAHGHVTGLGASLQWLNLRGTTSFRQIVDRVRQRVAS